MEYPAGWLPLLLSLTCPPPDSAIKGPLVDKKRTPQWSPHSLNLLMGLEFVPKTLGHDQQGGGQR